MKTAFAAAAAFIIVLAGCTAEPDTGINPAQADVLKSRDTILLDTLIYYRDTLRFNQTIARPEGGNAAVAWIICNPCDTVSRAEGFTFTPKSPADTLFKEAYGFVSYENGAVDTYRVLISVRAGWPAVALSPSGPKVVVDLDSTLYLSAAARDENGVIRNYYWDLGGGVGPEDRGLDSTFSLRFLLPETRLLQAAVRDEDSLLSAPDSLWIEARPLRHDTMIYIYDSLSLIFGAAAGKTLSRIRWVDWPDDTVGTAADLTYTNRTAADTGRRVIVGLATYADQTLDTQRTIVHVNSALPKVKLTLQSGLRSGLFYSMVPYQATASATDENGSVTGLEWDLDGLTGYEKAGIETTAVALWKLPGPVSILARARDDDSLWSPAESLSLNLSPPSADTIVYFSDTLRLTLVPDSSKTAANAGWRLWLGDTLVSQPLFDLPILFGSDTGFQIYHGIVNYTDGSSDTAKTLVEVRTGIPKIKAFYLSGFTGLDTLCCADTILNFLVQATDDNGRVEGLEWDFNGDGLIDSLSQAAPLYETSTASARFILPGTYDVRVRVWDDDSLFSPPDTVRVTVLP